MSTHLFGDNPTRIGYEQQPWAVWILGMDDIHDRDTLDECLALASEFNAGFAATRAHHDANAPVLYAVVLHHGYAWSRSVGAPCGKGGCTPCAAKEEHA